MAATVSSEIVIVGAGRFGRELLAWIRLELPHLNVAGYIDDISQEADVLGPILGHEPSSGFRYVTAIGAPRDRQSVTTALEHSGCRFQSIVSPRASLIDKPADNAGIVILGNASISNNVVLGRHCEIHGFSIIGHDVVLGGYCTVGALAFIGGGAKLGEAVTVHPHATVLPDVHIGDGAIIGAGSVVTRSVPAGCTVFGNPAKVIQRTLV